MNPMTMCWLKSILFLFWRSAFAIITADLGVNCVRQFDDKKWQTGHDTRHNRHSHAHGHGTGSGRSLRSRSQLATSWKTKHRDDTYTRFRWWLSAAAAVTDKGRRLCTSQAVARRKTAVLYRPVLGLLGGRATPRREKTPKRITLAPWKCNSFARKHQTSWRL